MKQDIHETVKERYGRIATEKDSGCGSSCGCGPGEGTVTASEAVGYTKEELQSIPADADLGVGCGNPLALSDLREGETVLDLGSGAGIDCFLAAERVGPSGRVIGVDMTHEMIERAEKNARAGGYANVEFRRGHIEELPVEDDSVDLITSNCVINLSPDKPGVFDEALRVLRPGGRLAISDIVLTHPLPEAIRESVSAYVGCVAGASLRDDYLSAIRNVGFTDVEVVSETSYPTDAILDLPEIRDAIENSELSPEEARAAAASVMSMKVRAVKAH
ncbi:MAG: arsenite methyltransferase [Candidatus Krumholzibacteriota bacterium]|nr:arsenite methyltransferase [Candidatus Krumholzibacteriota bacterium]